MLCSASQKAARFFVVFDVPPAGPKPRDECERVILTEPDKLPRRVTPLRGAGPRRPEQTRYREERRAVQFEPGKSALQTQLMIVDPELLKEWVAEVRRGA